MFNDGHDAFFHFVKRRKSIGNRNNMISFRINGKYGRYGLNVPLFGNTIIRLPFDCAGKTKFATSVTASGYSSPVISVTKKRYAIAIIVLLDIFIILFSPSFENYIR